MTALPVLFFGVLYPSTSGHYAYRAGRPDPQGLTSPWATSYGPIGEFTGVPHTDPRWERKEEGVLFISRRPGWVHVGLWDQSGDSRMGSCACFAVPTEDLRAAWTAIRLHYPTTVARIEARVNIGHLEGWPRVG